MIEGDIIAGRHFPNKKPKHTLNELLDRYVQEIMPRKRLETQRSHRPVVTFWRQKLGHKLLSYMQRMILPLFWRVYGRPSETIYVTSRPCVRRYSHCLKGLGRPEAKLAPHEKEEFPIGLSNCVSTLMTTTSRGSKTNSSTPKSWL
jgi:hypothetical protein